MIGRLLRSRKAVARIGRTLVTACAAGTQIDSPCIKIKSAGGELQADLTTRRSMCNSACGYIFLGAARREVAPDAAMAVHSSKLTLFIRGHFSARQIEEVRARDIAKGNRERAAYIVAMGVSRELEDLITTVKFESPHTLTRAELYRFGVDTRPFSETSWTLENDPRPYVRKIASEKKSDGAFRTLEWRLYCYARDRASLMFAREFNPDAAGRSSLTITAGAQKSVAFRQTPARFGSYDVWNDRLAPDLLNAILAADQLRMSETIAAPDGTTHSWTFEINTEGLQTAWAQLAASCPAVPSVASPVKPSPVMLSPGPTSAHAP